MLGILLVLLLLFYWSGKQVFVYFSHFFLSSGWHDPGMQVLSTLTDLHNVIWTGSIYFS